jgi:proteic killer suppression protein
MEVTFSSRRLQQTCESATEMRRVYGAACAKKLMLRLTELRAATCLGDLRRLGGRCHELDAERVGQLAVELPSGRHLVFVPARVVERERRRRTLDWSAVDAIELIEIVNYHDG